MPNFVVLIDDGQQIGADGRSDFSDLDAAVEAAIEAALAKARSRAAFSGAHQRLSCDVHEQGTDDHCYFEVMLRARDVDRSDMRSYQGHARIREPYWR